MTSFHRVQHAYAAEYLLPLLHPGANVLDVGSGSGYLSAILFHLASSEDKPGKVVGVDHIPELVDWSIHNLKSDGLEQAIEQGHIKMVNGDGRLGSCSIIHCTVH
jgi:protein-L-isoaspartate(D-aspartate) O-methyltransferase